jgi:hypothetical protein
MIIINIYKNNDLKYSKESRRQIKQIEDILEKLEIDMLMIKSGWNGI